MSQSVPEVKKTESLPTSPDRWKPYRQLFELMAGERARYLAAIGLLLIAVVVDYVIPTIVQAAIDLLGGGQPGREEFPVRALRAMGVTPGEPATFWVPAALVAVVAVVSGALMYAKSVWLGKASEGVIRRLRNRLYDRLQHVPLGFHDKHQSGDLVQRCTSDVDTLRNFYSSQIVEIVRALMLLAVGVPLLFYYDWRMALASIALLPVIVGFSVFFFSRVKGRFKQSDDAEGVMSATLQENLTGIRVVRAFNRQEFEIKRFEEKNGIHRKLDWGMYKLMSLFWSSSDMLCFSQILIVLGYGVYSVSEGRIRVGEFLLFIQVVWRFLWPVREMGRILTELGKAVVSVGRVYEIAAHEPETEPVAPVAAPSRLSGRIEIRNLSFAHGEKKILSDINLTVEPGKTLALLGPSGAGKSSLIALLLRFYDYTDGSIRLDGFELKDLPRKFVRGQFGVVMQEPFLFSKTLRDNIRLGRIDAVEVPDTEIVNAAQQSAVHDSIEGFEKKYDTLLGERGVTLSGGQRQRVAIARALLRDSPILVLDDALSAVDTHTEATILDAIRSRAGKHTTLLIAHRLSTLMHADQIAVIEGGKVTQLGTHAELVSQDGLYQRLWNIQTALEDDLRAELGQPEVVAK